MNGYCSLMFLSMFLMFFYKSEKKHVFFLNLQTNVFNIYGYSQETHGHRCKVCRRVGWARACLDGYRTLRPQDTSASRHSGTLRHRSQDTSTPKTWYETLPRECRDRGKAGTLRPRTIPMRHSSTGDLFKLRHRFCGAEVSCGRPKCPAPA